MKSSRAWILAALAAAPCLRATDTILLDTNAPANVLVPSAVNGGSTMTLASWTNIADPANIASWSAGTTGVGYDTNPTSGGDYTALVHLNVQPGMQNINNSVFIRIPFSVTAVQLPLIKQLKLAIKVDDGFVAFLNGQEIAAENRPTTLAWNSAATASHDAPLASYEEFEFTPFLSKIQVGTNMLAIQGLNQSLTSSDLLVMPQVIASDVPPPPPLIWPELRFVDALNSTPVNFPTAIRHAGDGSNRLFICERLGTIKVLYNGTVSTFLDITSRVQSSTSTGDEQGLLGLAFPPGFGHGKDYFYVYYTTKVAGEAGYERVSRFHLSPVVPPDGVINIANPNSEEVLLSLADPYSNHNGGDLWFGPDDGYLYFGVGDGGSGDDPENRAQNMLEWWGKMHRIDVESPVVAPAKYNIPPTNPFVGNASAKPEIFHLGLRNPWRWSFDRLTHDMWIGDVGQGTYEEVDFVPAGTVARNFGWRRFEGLHVRPGESTPGTALTLGTLTDPVTETLHANSDISLTGGFVYRGPKFPRMTGVYFFADYSSRRLFAMQRDNQNALQRKTLLNPSPYTISTFGEDEAGNLYLANLQTAGANTGHIFEMRDSRDISYLQAWNIARNETNGRTSLHFGSAIGKTYQVQVSDDLQAWSPIGTTITATDYDTAWSEPVDPPAAPGRRYYRVSEQ